MAENTNAARIKVVRVSRLSAYFYAQVALSSLLLTPNDMSSSIPLAYLGVRKESEAPSIGRTSRRFSSDHAIGVSRQSPTTSSNGEPLGDIEPNERVDEIVPSIEFEEGGYGWVVTGCKLPIQTEDET